jgi:hypothetical protein
MDRRTVTGSQSGDALLSHDQQNVARIARTIDNVLICRAFLRSVLLRVIDR